MDKAWMPQSGRMDKLWKTLKAFTTTYPHSSTLCPHSAWETLLQSEDACGAIIRKFLYFLKAEATA
jgi:hypothetical protein